MATRRAFVRGAALAAGAGLLGFRPYAVAAEPLPETPTIRLMHQPLACYAPLVPGGATAPQRGRSN
jgi:hypothetical protein